MKTISERFTKRIKERTSIVGAYPSFSKDIYRERVWNPHEEMFECIKMYDENSFVQAAVNTMLDFIMGEGISVVSSDIKTQKLAQAYIDSIDLNNVMREVIENAIKTGNGYLELVYDRVSKLPKEFYPIADSSRIYLNTDEYGNSKKVNKLVRMPNGELENREMPNDEEFYLQRIAPVSPMTEGKWYNLSYILGSQMHQFRIYAIPIHKEKIIHYKINVGNTGIYGRSWIASALNDHLILKQVEESLATIAKFKAVPRDILQYGDKELPASDEELQDFLSYLESLEKDETAVINKPIKREMLSYAGADINLDYMIQHIKKKLIAGIAPDFIMGLGDQVNRATAGQMLLSYVLSIYAKRSLFLRPTQQKILYPWIVKNGLQLDGTYLKFGDLKFETKQETEGRIMGLWQSNLITYNEAREMLGMDEIGKEGDKYFGEWSQDMAPDLFGGDFSGEGGFFQQQSFSPHNNVVSYEHLKNPKHDSSTCNSLTGDGETLSSSNNLLSSYTSKLYTSDFEEEEAEDISFPHNPTGMLMMEYQMALNIRKTFRHHLNQVLEKLRQNKKVMEEKIRTEATIGIEAVDNVLGALVGVEGVLQPLITRFIKTAYTKGVKNVSKILNVGRVVPMNQRHLEAIQKTSFGYIKKLSNEKREELRGVLTEGVSQGDSITTITNSIRKTFNDVSFRSETIARTELNRTYNKASIQATKDSNVVDKMKFLTAYDERVCPVCRPLHNKVFKFRQLNKKNTPALHPNCRCGLIPHVEVKKNESEKQF